MGWKRKWIITIILYYSGTWITPLKRVPVSVKGDDVEIVSEQSTKASKMPVASTWWQEKKDSDRYCNWDFTSTSLSQRVYAYHLAVKTAVCVTLRHRLKT